jgi:hypothetical protein
MTKVVKKTPFLQKISKNNAPRIEQCPFSGANVVIIIFVDCRQMSAKIGIFFFKINISHHISV